jgi:hypothetical protein
VPAIFLLAALAFGGIFTWAALKKRPGTGTAPASALVVIGDSLAVGLAPYLVTWAQSRGLAFVQDAKVGRFTRQQGVTSVPMNSLVFVSLGTNDATSNVDGSILRAFAQALRARVPRAIVWLLPPATKPLPGLAAVRATIPALDVTVVQTTAPIRADGLHPVDYGQVARDVLPALEALR